ncbi:MAG: hypothetical protein HXK63_06860 [Campylobacter sp.]|nr:hypothetical protein [Campylobacter sp.]
MTFKKASSLFCEASSASFVNAVRQTALKYVPIIDKGAALKYHLRETTKAIKAGGTLKDYAKGGEKRLKQRAIDLRTSSNKAPSKYERRSNKAWR